MITLGITFTSHRAAVQEQLEKNKLAALHAMGTKAVELIIRKMQTGYHDPHVNRDSQGVPTGGTHTDIRFRGDLMRDVSYEVARSKLDTVDVGVPESYAPLVHEGTRFLPGRHFITDAIEEGTGELQAIAEQELKTGF